ncbi:MAG: glycosyltransferase [Deltaproteobacteria bacterium]|nr:glycosyltransferase [Candidatus Zymogenaceae bacterium]
MTGYIILFLLMVLFINIIANRLVVKEPIESMRRDTLPSVSVLIPTRNEARNIGACLRGALTQDHPKYEVIVVDDSSTDATVQIAQNIAANNQRLRVFRGRPIPPHWFGKTYAQYEAAQVSRGEYLLFLDADVVLDRRALSYLVTAAKKTGAGILSVLPLQAKEGFWEGLLGPFKYFHLFLFFPVYAMGWPWEAMAAYANGQCMLIERSAYKKIGGHSNASETLREGPDMARLLKRKGGKVSLLSGSGIARARLYGGPPELWDGFTRFLYTLAHHSVLGAIFMILAYAILFVIPVVKVIVALATGAKLASVGLSLAQVGLGMAMFLAAMSRYGLTISEVLFFPLGAAVWIVMIGKAISVSMSKQGINWKGRVIKLP